MALHSAKTWIVLTLIGAAAVAACADTSDDLLNGAGGRNRGGASSGGATNPDGTPATNPDGTPASAIGPVTTPGGTPQQQTDTKALFMKLEPALKTACAPCHIDGSSAAPAWLAGPDDYASIKADKNIVVADPATSLLLTKPQHLGSPLPDTLRPDALIWLTAEAALIKSAPVVVTESDTVALPNGPGTLTLPAPGGKITFTGSFAAGILTLKTVALAAPATTAIHAAGIHINIVHADNSVTVDESLADADTTAPLGGSAALGVGLVVIARVAADDKIKVVLDMLQTSTGVVTTPVGGCKDVASFTTNAVPAIQGNTCMNCHNTGGSGNGALDLSGLAANPPNMAGACGQAKSKIDTTNIAASPIITAPTGGIAAHPFKGANAAYKTSMTTWITAEK